MKDINTIALSGRFTRDAELKYLNNGTPLVSFTLAFNRSKKVGEEWGDEGNFIDATLFGMLGPNICQYMTKGKQVFVHGEIQQQRWETDGQSRSKIALIVRDIVLGQAPRGEGSRGDSGGFDDPDPNADQGGFEDDIPFN